VQVVVADVFPQICCGGWGGERGVEIELIVVSG
jgi:hypothetical protein